MREGHHQSDEHWNCFKGDVGETPEPEAYGLLQVQRHHLELKWSGGPYGGTATVLGKDHEHFMALSQNLELFPE